MLKSHRRKMSFEEITGVIVMSSAGQKLISWSLDSESQIDGIAPVAEPRHRALPLVIPGEGKPDGTSSFTLQLSRDMTGPGFPGSISVIIQAGSFFDYFARFGTSGVDSLSMRREDDLVLVGYPEQPGSAPDLSFANAVNGRSERGSYQADAASDGVERLVAFQRVPRAPVYVVGSLPTSEVWRELQATAAQQLL